MNKQVDKIGLNRRSVLKLGASLLSSSTLSLGSFSMLATATAKAAPVAITLDVQDVDGRATYNSVVPGLTIRTNPGGVIDVDFINSLPPLHDDCTDEPNNFHGLNTTNLHTHGLHVSPTTDSSGKYDADNVFVSVVPENQLVGCADVCGADVEKSFRWHKTKYRFELGEDHPSGTYWYHAHKHGSTSQQVGDGLSGPLIVDEKPGTMPSYIEKANEKILMLMNKGLVLADPNGGGEVDPVITMRPGEVQRWRIINALGNATDYSFIRTNLPELEMYLIAYDGFTLEKRVNVDLENEDQPWLNPTSLASGNRMDLIVRAPLDGEGLKSSKSIFSGLTDLIDLSEIRQFWDIDVEVSGEPVESEWSEDDSLPGCGLEPFDDSPLDKRELNFDRRVSIDGELFDGEIKQVMKKGTAEEWTVGNGTGALHVFHIHVNPFFVTHLNGNELPNDSPLRRWQDTLGVPTGSNNSPGSVTYKTRFEKYTGKFVIHCHVLRHEDQGMMQIVEVTD